MGSLLLLFSYKPKAASFMKKNQNGYWRDPRTEQGFSSGSKEDGVHMLTSDNGSNASMAAGQVSHKLPTSLSQLLQTAPRAGRERTGSREAGSAPAQLA